MVTIEDKLILSIDARQGQINLDNLLKQIDKVTGGIARLVSSKDIPTKGITRFKVEVQNTTKAVKELERASKSLQKIYKKNITGVSSEFKQGRKKGSVAPPMAMPGYVNPAAMVPPVPSQFYDRYNLPENVAGTKEAEKYGRYNLPKNLPVSSAPLPANAFLPGYVSPSLEFPPMPTNFFGRYGMQGGIPEEVIGGSQFGRYGLPTEEQIGALAPEQQRKKPTPAYQPLPGYVSPSAMIPPMPTNFFGLHNLPTLPEETTSALSNLGRYGQLVDVPEPAPKPVISRFIERDLSYDPLSPENQLGEEGIERGNKARKKEETLLQKTGKGLKNLTKQTFMLQMGMLGTSFSMMGLMTSIQGLVMGGLTGLSDTESLLQNLAISDALGGTSFLENIDMGSLIESSLNAKGALAGLQTVLAQIMSTVFTKENTDKIANALQLIVDNLTKPEFIEALNGIIDAITSEDFINSLTNAAIEIGKLIEVLGEKGLLDDVILLMIACQFLMPVFAALQLLLIALGSTTLLYLIAAIIIVGSVVMALVAGINEWGKSGNILLDVINVIITAFIKLWETMLYLPTVVFDTISRAISDLTGGLINLTNPFKAFTDTMWGFKDLLNTTFSGNKENYDTGTHSYTNTTINYNAPVTIPKTSVQPIR